MKIIPDQKERQVWVDSLSTLLLFVLLLFTGFQVSKWFLIKQPTLGQAEPVITKETIDYLLNKTQRGEALKIIFNPQEILSLAKIKAFFFDSQVIWVVFITVALCLSISFVRTFRSSIHRERIELVAEHTLETAFVITTIAISLSPFLAWIYQRYLLPSWKLNLGVLYPILINEFVLALAITTLLAGIVVGILWILEPRK
jgi:hypothetical protein